MRQQNRRRSSASAAVPGSGLRNARLMGESPARTIGRCQDLGFGKARVLGIAITVRVGLATGGRTSRTSDRPRAATLQNNSPGYETRSAVMILTCPT